MCFKMKLGTREVWKRESKLILRVKEAPQKIEYLMQSLEDVGGASPVAMYLFRDLSPWNECFWPWLWSFNFPFEFTFWK